MAIDNNFIILGLINWMMASVKQVKRNNIAVHIKSKLTLVLIEATLESILPHVEVN